MFLIFSYYEYAHAVDVCRRESILNGGLRLASEANIKLDLLLYYNHGY